jgi:hypothetical protein
MRLEAVFKRRCEAIAVDWRHRFGLSVYSPLRAEAMVRELQGEAVTPDLLPLALPNVPAATIQCLMTTEDWSAGILRLTPLLIVYHHNHSPARRESDLMHEIAHVLLQHPMISFSPATGLPLRDPRHEDEATYLGSCLQIPRLGLEWAIKKGFGSISIAEHFGASKEMVQFRCNMTGYGKT